MQTSLFYDNTDAGTLARLSYIVYCKYKSKWQIFRSNASQLNDNLVLMKFSHLTYINVVCCTKTTLEFQQFNLF